MQPALSSQSVDHVSQTQLETAAGAIKEASVTPLENPSLVPQVLSTPHAVLHAFLSSVAEVLFREPAIVTTPALANPIIAMTTVAARNVPFIL